MKKRSVRSEQQLQPNLHLTRGTGREDAAEMWREGDHRHRFVGNLTYALPDGVLGGGWRVNGIETRHRTLGGHVPNVLRKVCLVRRRARIRRIVDRLRQRVVRRERQAAPETLDRLERQRIVDGVSIPANRRDVGQRGNRPPWTDRSRTGFGNVEDRRAVGANNVGMEIADFHHRRGHQLALKGDRPVLRVLGLVVVVHRVAAHRRQRDARAWQDAPLCVADLAGDFSRIGLPERRHWQERDRDEDQQRAKAPANRGGSTRRTNTRDSLESVHLIPALHAARCCKV